MLPGNFKSTLGIFLCIISRGLQILFWDSLFYWFSFDISLNHSHIYSPNLDCNTISLILFKIPDDQRYRRPQTLSGTIEPSAHQNSQGCFKKIQCLGLTYNDFGLISLRMPNWFFSKSPRCFFNVQTDYRITDVVQFFYFIVKLNMRD